MQAGQQILLIGFGNMGQALVRGWLAEGRAASSIRVVDPIAVARAAASALGIEAHRDIPASPAELVIVAVKPAQLRDAARGIQAVLAPRSVVLSIVAGKTLAQLEALLGDGTALVRAMPNTPAAIGRGITVLCANRAVDARRREACAALMSAVGRVEWLADEQLMDAVTAVSGSGPAYVFLLIECLSEAGRQAGLDRELAIRLATETVAGAGLYAAGAEETAAELRRRVTSPNGTTQAALEVLLGAGGLQELIGSAVRAATERSRALSQESS